LATFLAAAFFFFAIVMAPYDECPNTEPTADPSGTLKKGPDDVLFLEGFPARVNRSPAEPGRRTAPASTKPFPSMSFRVDITPQPDPLQPPGIVSMKRFVDQRIRFTNRSSTMQRDIS